MSYEQDLISRLDACPTGKTGWREFENLCIEILTHLFVPPLKTPRIQVRTVSGVQRRDAIFSNRKNADALNNWGRLYRELAAKIILFEFKNYSRQKVGRDEVIQVHSYMRKEMGRLAVIVSSKEASKSAYQERVIIFNREAREVILFITKDNLKEMLNIKERGEDPSDFIFDLVDEVYTE